jgi:hypothetical protein
MDNILSFVEDRAAPVQTRHLRRVTVIRILAPVVAVIVIQIAIHHHLQAPHRQVPHRVHQHLRPSQIRNLHRRHLNQIPETKRENPNPSRNRSQNEANRTAQRKRERETVLASTEIATRMKHQRNN